MSTDDGQPIVIDNGSDTTKAGFATDTKPRAIFSSVIGKTKYQGVMGTTKKDYVGGEAQARRGILSLKYPIQRGVVSNWADVEQIWNHTFDGELRVDPKRHPILLSEPPLNSTADRDRMAQIMFETFDVPGLLLDAQPVLSIYACSSRLTGIVLDSGDGVTHAVPIVGRHPVREAVVRRDVAGRDLTEYLSKMLADRGYLFSTTAEHEIVRDLKETLCYVADDFDLELDAAASSSTTEKSYVLPDGHALIVGAERFRCPEALFRPSVVGIETGGIDAAVVEAIRKCDESIRADLYANVVLSGGSTMFRGLVDRLGSELNRSAPRNVRVRIVASPERKYLSWIGGTIMASLSTFWETMISREEYAECGASAVRRKCF